MSEMNNAAVGVDVEKEKLEKLCDLITARADEKCENLLSEAQKEMESWIAAQEAEIEKNSASAIAEAEKGAAENLSRRVANAKSEAEKERLKLLSGCVEKAQKMFLERLKFFSTRVDYPEILTGVAVKAAASLARHGKLSVRLSQSDAKHSEAVINGIKKKFPHIDVSFDNPPADIDGGAEIRTNDGRWKIVSDWQAKVEELADAMASRVLSAL